MTPFEFIVVANAIAKAAAALATKNAKKSHKPSNNFPSRINAYTSVRNRNTHFNFNVLFVFDQREAMFKEVSRGADVNTSKLYFIQA